MSFWDGFSKNWADIAENAADPGLRAVDWPLPVAESVSKAEAILRRLPRWRVESADPGSGTLHATHKTLVWRFVDDIRLKFEPIPHGTRITGHSQSRIGKADLGQNARNLREITKALRP